MMPVLINLGPLTIYSFGVLLLIGVFFGMFVAWKKLDSYHIDEHQFFDVIIESLTWGLILGRIIYVVTHFSDFGFNVVRWFWLTHYVGLSFWGILIGMVVALVLRVKSAAQDFWKWLDLISMGIAGGLVFGKLGVFMSGGGGLWFLPLIEAGLFFGLFVWMYWLDGEYRTISWYRAGKTYAQTGFLWFWFLAWTGVIELLAEFGKVPSGTFGVGRLVDIIVLLIGIGGLYARSGRNLRQDYATILKGFSKKK